MGIVLQVLGMGFMVSGKNNMAENSNLKGYLNEPKGQLGGRALMES